MLETFELLKPLLADPDFTLDSIELRETVCAAANRAFSEIAAAGPADKAAAEVVLRAYLANAGAGRNAFRLSLLKSLIHAATGEAAWLKAAIEAALSEDIDDVGVGMNNLYVITRLAFLDQIGADDLAGLFDYEARHRYWLRLIDQAEAVVGAAGLERGSAPSDNGRVLILTEQFLQPPHAPTKDALEYGRKFQDAGGREVLIVSTCAFGRQLYSAILPGSQCNVNDGLATVPAFEFEGRAFRYYQPATGRFNNATLIETLRVIEDFDPAFVLVIGQQNLVGELLSRRSFVIQYPTIAGLPTTRDLRFFMWRPPTAEETVLMKRTGLDGKYLFAHHPGFEPPERTTRLTRAEFGIPADAFVFAVVRMRLDGDITEDFLALMREIRARRPKAHFAFVGEFDAFQTRIGDDPSLAGAATHLGFQSDILAAYALCDAYINPTPKGGGSAIVHALSAGLPALSTNRGDAYEAVRDFPLIEDHAALARVACELADRGETYQAYVRAVRERAPGLQSKAAVVERMLAAYERFLGDQPVAADLDT